MIFIWRSLAEMSQGVMVPQTKQIIISICRDRTEHTHTHLEAETSSSSSSSSSIRSTSSSCKQHTQINQSALHNCPSFWFFIHYTQLLITAKHDATNVTTTGNKVDLSILCFKKMTLTLHTITSTHINRFW